MSRIVSVWLENWTIARLVLTQGKAPSGSWADAADPRRPLALVAPGKGGPHLVAVNTVARTSGLLPGELLSSARSKVLDLQVRDADPAADAAVLRRLGLWCLRYTPLVTAWDETSGGDGLFLEVAGSAHLFGGEEGLLADIAARLRSFGLNPRLAIADTAGAAWAASRYGIPSIPSGAEEQALRDLPLAALRLSADTQLLLHRLGFRRIGQVMDEPRAPFAARFGTELLHRLDEALGRRPEPLVALVPPPCYRAQATFLEPILTEEHVVEAARRLLGMVSEDLARDEAGARRVRLLLFHVDGDVRSLDIGLAAPSRDAAHLARLIALRLGRLPARLLDAGFGFEAMAVHVLCVEKLSAGQATLAHAGEGSAQAPASLAPLVDKLVQRLGPGAVRWLAPRQSHIPERAVTTHAAGDGPASQWREPTPGHVRPLLLLPRPETTEVIAVIPEAPPRRFRWRGVLHQVAHAEGPERIAPEWWRRSETEVERDYYVVEDTDGRRFWLYRLYGRNEGQPRWFVHGVFA